LGGFDLEQSLAADGVVFSTIFGALERHGPVIRSEK
jgi:hypothetical protein